MFDMYLKILAFTLSSHSMEPNRCICLSLAGLIFNDLAVSAFMTSTSVQTADPNSVLQDVKK